METEFVKGERLFWSGDRVASGGACTFVELSGSDEEGPVATVHMDGFSRQIGDEDGDDLLEVYVRELSR